MVVGAREHRKETFSPKLVALSPACSLRLACKAELTSRREPLVCAPRKSVYFFLTSTAFVDTNAKLRPRRGENLIKKFFDAFQILCCLLCRIRKHFSFFQNVFIGKIFKTFLNGCCIHTNVFLKNICQIFTS